MAAVVSLHMRSEWLEKVSLLEKARDVSQSGGEWQVPSMCVPITGGHALVKGTMADPAGVFARCPALAAGLTPFSAVKLPRRRFWHPTMHAWCAASAKACVLAVLVAELRVDRQEDQRLPSLPHELWLLILEFAPRRELGAPAV